MAIRYTLHTHTHTHAFNGPFSRSWVSWYQKGKTNLDFSEARDIEWQWHQLDHMQICISLQTDNHASTPPITFFTGQMPFLPPNQQRQSAEGNRYTLQWYVICTLLFCTVQLCGQVSGVHALHVHAKRETKTNLQRVSLMTTMHLSMWCLHHSKLTYQ